MKRLLNFILRKKVVDLDNDGKIETLREEINGVFSQFRRMADRLDGVNKQLDEIIEDEKFVQECERDNLQRIIEEAERKLAESDKRVEKAELEKQANTKLKEKVSEFIV
jgi:phosphoglycerate-specific signal transduction histidine kinase